MLFESQEGRVAQQVFQTLSDRIRQTNYKISDQEKRAFAECSTDVGGNLLLFGGGFAGAGYLFAKKAAGAGKSSRWGRFIATTAGFYLGTQIALRGVKEGCLERIVSLPTPLGSEAAAILREKAPNSNLLAKRPADFDESRLRLQVAASIQRAHEQAGMTDSAHRAAPSMQQPQPTRRQTDQGQQAQPDALGNDLGAFGFTGEDDWCKSETEDTHLGLNTVRRSKGKHRRQFTHSENDSDQSSDGAEDSGSWGPWVQTDGSQSKTSY